MDNAEKFKEPGLLLLPDFLDPSQSFKNICWSFVGGTFAGIANVIVGHPLDTLKVRMQMLNVRLIECGKTMFKQEGLSSFYKGLSSPLCNVPLVYAILLSSYEAGRIAQGIGFHEQMSISQSALSGGWAGMASCIVLTPMEMVKCQMQMEMGSQSAKRATAMQTTKAIIKNHGVKGLYKGNLITVLREIPGVAVYFASYEYFKMLIEAKFGETHWNPLVAGGLAGFLSWVVSYPQDAVKTKLQCDLGPVKMYPSHKWLKDGGIISCTKDIWRTDGMPGFWRGFSACALRSIISEAFSFLVYERARKQLTPEFK